MFYTVYKITNKINGKIYYGKEQTKKLNKSYMGSGKIIKRAVNKYGKENFEKEILFFLDNYKDMNDKEREIIAEENAVADPNSYNMKEGGEGGWDYVNNDPKIQEKISKKKKEPEYRAKISKRMTGQWADEEFKIQRSESIKNVCESSENREKQSERSKRMWASKEYQTKHAEAVNTPEHKEKLSLSIKQHYIDNPDSRIKQSERIKEACKKPEVKKRKSEASKLMWQSEEYQRKISKARKETGQSEEFRKKQSDLNKGKFWITDGINSKFIPGTDPIPNGWWKGREISSTKDTMWITNGIKNQMIPKTNKIPEGWSRGVTKGNKHVN